MNHTTPILIFTFMLFMVACSNSQQSPTTTETNEISTQELQEVVKLDSVSNEMEEVSTEIQQKTKELDAALDDIMKEFEE